jgi:hydrogen cyanide synthase HcnB
VYEATRVKPRFVVVGAGPAGMRAAEQLVAAGYRPTVVDEAPRFGGQVYRQPPDNFERERRDLYGFEARKASAILDRFAALLPQIDYRPDTLVWQVEHNSLQLLCEGRDEALGFDALILATGATDRVLPFPGWTLPGVYTLGAAQVALKYQACLIGPRVAFAGTGPLLYLVAWQYASHGGQVAAVLDSSAASAKLQALPKMLARPEVAAKGAYYLARLRLAGVPLHTGVSHLRAEGSARVSAISWQAGDARHSLPCDAIGVGHGLRSETQLADLAGCTFEFNEIDQAWLPVQQPSGRSSVRGVYLAGDGAAILGADAAELSGARAALAALEDQGHVVPQTLLAPLEKARRKHLRFRQGMEQAFAPPPRWAAEAPNAMIVCRCEEITASELRLCAEATGTREINRLKALTRIGMGRCQGRMCAAAAARLLADEVGCELKDVGRLRGQAPVKPLPIRLLREAMDEAPVPFEERDD